MKRENMVWVHTFEIGTNAGRKEMRKVYDSLQAAEAQQEVLGGRIREYVETESVQPYKVRWPANLSADDVRDAMRAAASAHVFRDQYMCHPVYDESVQELIIDEISCLIDDMTNHSPYGPWSAPAGSPGWDKQKVSTLNNFRSLLSKIK